MTTAGVAQSFVRDSVPRGLGFGGAVAPTLVLLGFAALFAVLAATRFRWEEA